MAGIDNVVYNIQSLLSSPGRDYLVQKNGNQVKLDNLKGKKVGFYFSAFWCPPCRRFTPTLVELYNEFFSKDFEIVFVSRDKDEDSFNDYFSKMPWLAIPFSDSNTRKHLNELFKGRGIPHLVILDENEKVATADGTMLVRKYGVEAYPITREKIKQLKDQEEEAKKNQSLRSLLVYKSRDFIISPDGKQVLVSELEGKMVGLYFTSFSYKAPSEFRTQLVKVYETLKGKGEDFEIVLISIGDEDEESFTQELKSLPWLALPYKDKMCEKLIHYFELSSLPTLVIIGRDGKTLHSNVAKAIEKYGVDAYPFTPQKFEELADTDKVKEEFQTLESSLVSGDLDFVIGKEGIKIPVSNLVGKTILLYFSAQYCPPCRAFLPKLIEAYHKMKGKDNALEIIFISSDIDQASFNDLFAKMPWLALPFGDSRTSVLSHKFEVNGIPMLVVIGPNGRILTKEARDLVALFGAEAYPFTEERVKVLEAAHEEIAKGKEWPEKVTDKSHVHELVLSRRRVYYCDGCDEEGQDWSYLCEKCDFDLHPKCALEEDKLIKGSAKEEEEKN